MNICENRAQRRRNILAGRKLRGRANTKHTKGAVWLTRAPQQLCGLQKIKMHIIAMI